MVMVRANVGPHRGAAFAAWRGSCSVLRHSPSSLPRVSAGDGRAAPGLGAEPFPPAEGPSLPLPGREQVLEHAARLILDTWRSFDHARPGQPLPAERHHELLSRALPA